MHDRDRRHTIMMKIPSYFPDATELIVVNVGSWIIIKGLS